MTCVFWGFRLIRPCCVSSRVKLYSLNYVQRKKCRVGKIHGFSLKEVKICQGAAPSPFLFGSPPRSSDWSPRLEGYNSQTPASWSSLLRVEKHKKQENQEIRNSCSSAVRSDFRFGFHICYNIKKQNTEIKYGNQVNVIIFISEHDKNYY